MIYSLLDIISSYQIKSAFKSVTNELVKAEDTSIDAEIIEETDAEIIDSDEKEKTTTTKTRRKSTKKKDTNKDKDEKKK